MSTPELTATPQPAANFFGVPFEILFNIIIIAAIAITLERLVTRYLSRFAKRTKLEPNVANNLALTFRILVLIVAVGLISSISGVNSTWIVSISAIGAAAVGFASQKTIGNIIAGIFLIAAKPFKVGDYVRIGTVEGIVSELSINYTKILTINNNTVSISNLQILDREITNYLYECTNHTKLYCYTFEAGFDHNVPSKKITEIFNQVFEKYTKQLPRKPSFMLTRSTATDRVYTIYLYVNEPEVVFDLRPKIAQEIFELWDMERAIILKK